MKKKFKFISLFLVFVVLSTFLTPLNAYAANKFSSYVDVSFINRNDNQLGTTQSIASFPGAVTLSNTYQIEVNSIDLDIDVPVQIDKESKVTLTLNSWQNGRYSKWGNMYLVDVAVESQKVFKDVSIKYGGSSNGIYTITFTANKTIKANENIELYLTKPYYTTDKIDQMKAYFKITSVEFEIVDKAAAEQSNFFNRVGDFFSNLFDKLTAWFNSLFGWLKDIRDSVGNWFSELGTKLSQWFSDLTDSLSSFFSNLIKNVKTFFSELSSNLKTWFSNVGQWFKDIGDRISGFFSDLWTNIKVNFDGTVQDIRDWWQSVVDWFHNLFVPEDGYFDEYHKKWNNWFKAHFGFIYESVQLIDSLFTTISNGLSGKGSGVIIIPEISLPFNNLVILHRTTFDLENLFESHEQIKMFWETFQYIIVILSFIGLVFYGKKVLEEIIADREL